MAKTESTRVAFLQGLIDVMRENPKAVVVFADSVKVFRATAAPPKVSSYPSRRIEPDRRPRPPPH